MSDGYELPELSPDEPGGPDLLAPYRHGVGNRHRANEHLQLDADGAVVRADGGGSFLRDLVVIVALAIVISIVVKTFFLRPFAIPSGSMRNTLVEGDRVLVNLLSPNLMDVHRGDVIVFQDPGGWLPEIEQPDKPFFAAVTDGALELVGLKAEESTGHLIKRVIGLPGDHVVCCNAYGQLEINDVAIDEPYIIRPEGENASGMEFDVTVPDRSVWVMGDNRYNSEDSRFHANTPTKGFVPYDDIVGQAFVINWPLNRFTWIDSSPQTFVNVPSREPQP